MKHFAFFGAKSADMTLDAQLWRAAQTLAREVDALSFGAPVTHVYNPLRYAAPRTAST